MSKVFDQKVLDFLKSSQIVPETELISIFEESQKGLVSFEDLLLEKGLVKIPVLGQIEADLLDLPYVFLANEHIQTDILNIVPEVVARGQRMILFGRDESGLKLAMSKPENNEAVEFLAKKTGEQIKKYFTTNKEINDAMTLYRKDLQKSFDELLAEKVKNVAPITEIVDLLLEYAFNNHASDIHIEPERDESVVRFRIDGVLHIVVKFKKELHDQIVSRIKVAAKLQTDEHLSAQDGKMEFETEGERLDIRVSIVPIVNGEKVVLRLLSSKSKQFGLVDLGMSDKDLAKVTAAFRRPFGMVLSTGPTGSGKTTSIYAILKILNTKEVNIATIEDPVEYDIAGVNQIQVNPKTNLTFADGLRSILRQDPNIIFVGEIRDEETAKIAVNSATTGHLVLSTLHTNDAATTLPRLIDMGVEPYLIASTVNAIVGQRLVRKICAKCRTSIDIDKVILAKSFPNELVNRKLRESNSLRAYVGKGCEVCHKTGYVGRVGVFEVLEVGEEIRELITEKVSADKIRARAMELGMTTMMEDGWDKVAQGLTTVDEVLKATSG